MGQKKSSRNIKATSITQQKMKYRPILFQFGLSLMIFCIIAIVFLWCHKPSFPNEAEHLQWLVNFFESQDAEQFKGYRIEKQSMSVFSVKRHHSLVRDEALIQISPKPIIGRNFKTDPIDLNFVQAFKTLKCDYIIYTEAFTQVRFGIGSHKRIILYTHPITSDIFSRVDTANSFDFNGKWRYIKSYKGEVIPN